MNWPGVIEVRLEHGDDLRDVISDLSDGDLELAASAAFHYNVWSPLAKEVLKEVTRRWRAMIANESATASGLPADVREALERTLAPLLWVADYVPGIGDKGYYVTDPRDAASTVLDALDVRLRGTTPSFPSSGGAG